MAFPIGAAVVVHSLGKKRGIVIHSGRDGRYRVQVEGLTISCREEDLSAPEGRRGRTSKSKSTPASEGAGPLTSEAARPGRVDLHGLTVDDAVEQVTQAIDSALRGGADRVEVIHGKGTRRIQNAVHRYLATLPIVAAFRLDPTNPGITWVWLR
jgi:DNA mismatch repair protein MutS2